MPRSAVRYYASNISTQAVRRRQPRVVRDVTRAGRGVIVLTAPIFRAESVSSSRNGWTSAYEVWSPRAPKGLGRQVVPELLGRFGVDVSETALVR